MTPWTIARQAPLSMEFSRQKYWSGLPFPSLRDLPNPGIKPVSVTPPVLAAEFSTTTATWGAPTDPGNLSKKEEFNIRICRIAYRSTAKAEDTFF